MSDPFLAAVDPPRVSVDVPGIAPVLVRGLLAAEWDKVEAACVVTTGEGKDAKAKFEPNRALVVRYGAIRDDGSHRFTDADVPRLAALPISRIKPVYLVIERLSGLADTGDGRGKDSGPTGGGDSG